MLEPLPIDLARRYEIQLEQTGIARPLWNHYTKWLRYYWDFCHKYAHPPNEQQSFPPFDKKLRAKHQSESQRQQARQALSLFTDWRKPICAAARDRARNVRRSIRTRLRRFTPNLGFPPSQSRQLRQRFDLCRKLRPTNGRSESFSDPGILRNQPRWRPAAPASTRRAPRRIDSMTRANKRRRYRRRAQN